MHAVVVYESMWGNTREIAEAVAQGLGEGTPVIEVATAPALPDGLDLLVVGGPTHAFSMSRPSTREDAGQRGAGADSSAPGLREWLAGLPGDFAVPIATFDTRVRTVRHLPGSAAKAAKREVERHHHGTVVDAVSFYVHDVAGPLEDGELQRAREWGAGLAAAGIDGS
ncbi:hypothetical protein [Nocardioides sp. zg-DK7169]|uniref:flavodoxin family protein n=1 Tax=Nocardioides sp. zg-DK7169 TaxID=2736600 RepID=UPI0015516661|nr:hypothetical protein [Nocardioides sp. zg-DK7169]NPC97448.1 hypothetical protein [Nocardioides sp. zg-DK7169]